MTRYTVFNTATEEKTPATTWRAAVGKASRMDPMQGEVIIIERDDDGCRAYGPLGDPIDDDYSRFAL